MSFAIEVANNCFGEVELSVFYEVNILNLVPFMVESGFVLAGDFSHVIKEGFDAVTVYFFEELKVN